MMWFFRSLLGGSEEQAMIQHTADILQMQHYAFISLGDCAGSLY